MIEYSKMTTELTLKEKVGQLFMPAAFINDSEEEVRKLERLIKLSKIGGLCFFHSRASAATNYEGKKEVLYNKESLSLLKQLINRYQKVSKTPLLISIDAEWGLAMRVENTPQYPYAITLGALEAEDNLIFEVGKNIGIDCRDAGIHWNFAPVADINSNPNNPVISYRSFGSNKIRVANKSTAMMKGLEAGGVLNSAKHFPGHGDTATDSHLGLPLIDKTKEELWENELYPFRELVNNGIDSIMVGHLSVPALADGSTEPSSLSKKIIKGLLREEMGFTGVVVSDALNMHAVSKLYPVKGNLEWLAFDAGNDVLCFAENVTEGINTILEKGTPDQIETSFKRVWKLKEKAYSLNQDIDMDKTIKKEDLNLQIAKNAITLAYGNKEVITSFYNSRILGITAGNNGISKFFESCLNTKEFPVVNINEIQKNQGKDKLQKATKILLAIYPPSVKPNNHFGFSTTEIEMINEILATKEVVIYLFGNPYFMNHLNPSSLNAAILAYQDFEEFQEMALKHFLGKLEANGSIPITLDD